MDAKLADRQIIISKDVETRMFACNDRCRYKWEDSIHPSFHTSEKEPSKASLTRGEGGFIGIAKGIYP